MEADRITGRPSPAVYERRLSRIAKGSGSGTRCSRHALAKDSQRRRSSRFAFPGPPIYLGRMLRSQYRPCIPTRSTEVPAGLEWLHEIKHDGYRLIVQREGKRVRLLTRRGYDWSDRFPLISEAARRLPTPSFVIDGEADGIKVKNLASPAILRGKDTSF